MLAYGYEQPVAITPVEVFNPTTANMVLQSMQLYAQALRDEYKNALQEQKDFLKEHRSFISPSDADTKRYYNLTIGRMNDLFDYANKNGIDLFRTPQGQSLVRQYISDTDYPELAKLRKSSETLQKYDDLAREMLAKGIDVLDPINTSAYDTHKSGIFNGTPIQNKNISEYWKPSLDAIKDRDHIVDDGKGHVYHQMGVTEDDVRDVVNANWNTYVNSAYGKRHMDDAKAKLLLQNPELTNDPEKLNGMAEQQIKDAIVKQGVRSKSSEADPYALIKFKTDEAIREESNTANYKGSGGRGSGKELGYDFDDIFEESYRKEGGVDYNIRDSYGLRISPSGNVGQLMHDDKNNRYYYNVSAEDLGIRNSNYKNNTYRYYPTGRLKSVKTEDGSYRSFILGDVWSSDGKKVMSGKPYIVSRRGSRYGDKPLGVKK